MSPSLSVASTSPASSAVLASSPTDLFVSFDRPIDPFSLGNADFQLVHVAADGSNQPLKTGEAGVSEALDPADPTGVRIDLSLSSPLLPGRYRLLLTAGSQIQGLDGSSLANPTSDSILSSFKIGQPDLGRSAAIDLGTIGSTETIHNGALDLANNPAQVQYYKITIAPGHHWRLGVEVSAQSDGSSLASTLSLFDSTGHLIATDSVGLPGASNDPYLFAGVGTGTYYIGVSAKANIPDASGHYDPSQAIIGTSQPGGSFRVHFLAEAADQQTRVLGVRVDRADPLSTNPTGLTLQFSGAIAIPSTQVLAFPGLTLVDQDGLSWPITLLGYDASQGQLSLAFNRPLPSGTYRLEVATAKGLVDLAGNRPIGKGLYSTTLASFSFDQQDAVAGDLGPILPAIASSGLSTTLTVSPDQATSEQFVVVEPGVYVLNERTGASGVSYSVSDALGNVLATGLGSATTAETHLNLTAGVYRISITTTSATPVEVDQTIRRKDSLLSSLIESGVAQGPALNLRLVTPQANFGQTSSDSSPISNPSTSTSTPGPQASGSDSLGQAGAVGVASTVLVGLRTPSGPSVAGTLLYGTGPVGRTSSESNQISAVGPSGSSGSVAIASNTPGLPSGLVAVPVEIDVNGELEPDAPPLRSMARAEPPASVRGSITLEAGLITRAPGSRRADDQILEEVDIIGQLVADVVGWLDRPAVDGATMVAEVPAIAPASRQGEVGPGEVQEPRLETASFSSPIGVGVVVATIAYRYRRNILGALRLRTKAASQQQASTILKGPHRRSRIRVRLS